MWGLSCPLQFPLQSLDTTVTSPEGSQITGVVMADPAGVHLSLFPAYLAQGQGAATAVATTLLFFCGGQDPLLHLRSVHLPAHHRPLGGVVTQQAGQCGRAPGELLRGRGEQRHFGPDRGTSWKRGEGQLPLLPYNIRRGSVTTTL